MSVVNRCQLDVQMASARQQWELAAAARHAGEQDMNDEWQMRCVLSGLIGAATALSRDG